MSNARHLPSAAPPGGIASRHFLIVIVLIGTLPVRGEAGDLAPPLLRSLLEGTDAVLAGTVEGVARAPGGVWHLFRASSVLRGEVTPGELVHLFTHGAGVPDSAEIVPGERTVIGVRWLVNEGPYQERLLRSVAERDSGGRAGLVAPDGVFVLAGADGTGLLDQVRALLGSAAGATAGAHAPGETAAEGATSDLAALLESEHPAVRAEVLRRLAQVAGPLATDTVDRVRQGLRAELDGAGDPAVLQGYADVIRLHRVTGCHESLCEFVLLPDEPALAAEGIDALARVEPEESLRALLVVYPSAGPLARGRILRALARLEWPGAVHLIREALEGPDNGLHSPSIEALGESRSPESTALLEEIARHAGRDFRALAVEALERQRTSRSHVALRRLLEESAARQEREVKSRR